MQENYLHFNAAAMVDAAKGYEQHLLEGGKMLVSLAGAMSTAELGISLAEMIRAGKVDIISCTGANLEEDIMNLVAVHLQTLLEFRDLAVRTHAQITLLHDLFEQLPVMSLTGLDQRGEFGDRPEGYLFHGLERRQLL